MNRQSLSRISCAAATVLFLSLSVCPRMFCEQRVFSGSNSVSNAWAGVITNQVRELNSAASALFELAGERFAMNENQGRTWIMTLYNPTEHFGVLKYTDGKIVVVAVPVMTPDDESGLRQYVDHYNSYNVRSADLKVKAGKYEQARELYEVLLHFNPHGSLADGLRKRLEYLTTIEKGEDVEENVRKLMNISADLTPSFLTGMEDAPLVKVNNLLDVNVSR